MAKKDEKKTENEDTKRSDSQELESEELIKVLNKISENIENQNKLLQKQVQQESSQSFSDKAIKAVKGYSEITAALKVSKSTT